MSTELVRWNAAVASGDPARVADVAVAAAQDRPRTPPEWIFTVTDFLWRAVGELGADLIEASGTDPRNAAGSASITVKGTSTLVGELMKCRTTMVGVKVETAGLKYGFYVNKHKYAYRDGAWTSQVELRSIWNVLNHMTIFPTWFLPIQAQPISHAIYCGPIVSVIETMIHECAFRIQTGTWETVNNMLSFNPDLRAWFGTMLQSDGTKHRRKYPVYVVRTNPFLDTSPLVVKLVRMESVGQVITDLTGPYGVDVSVTLWEPGDPQPDRWANLERVTYVVRVRDRSQITGPTKTILDSAIRTVVDITGSIFGQAVAPLVTEVDSMRSQFISPRLGVDFVEPWVILEAPEPGRHGSVLTAEIIDHTPQGWRHIIGGKSPAWLVRAPLGDRGGADRLGLSRTLQSTRCSVGRWTASPSCSASSASPPTCCRGSSTTHSSRSPKSTTTTAATRSGPTIQPKSGYTQPNPAPTTSPESQISSRRSMSRGAGRRLPAPSATATCTPSDAISGKGS